MPILTLANALTLMRLPLAFLFLYEDIGARLMALILAMVSDSCDGFIARRYSQVSQLGAMLDPLMDKFFVVFILLIFWTEGRLTFFDSMAFLSRDIAVMMYGLYLVWRQRLAHYRIRAIFWGKVATAMQLTVLIGLLFYQPLPKVIPLLFIAIGCFSFIELYLRDSHVPP